MSFHQFISILKARRLVWGGILLLTVATTVVVSLLLPNQYTASSAVVVDVKSPDPIAGIVLQGMMTPSYMATQVDIIQSDRVAQRVLKMLRLDQSPQMREQWQEDTDGAGSFDAWLAERLQKKLEVKPQRESNVINVAYTAVDPQFAAVVANAFVKAYIDTSLELRVEPAKQFATMFEEQLKQARNSLEAAQSKLSEYQRQKGIVATDERMDVENARLLELSSQLVALQSQSADSRSRKQQAGANSPEVLSNMVVASLKADLSRQEAKLKELSATLGSAHPQVRELQANIAELRSKMEGEINRVTGSVTINNTVNQSREAQIRAALDAQRDKILKMKVQRDEASVLLKDVESAQKSYDAVQARLTQSSLESQSNQTNVSLLKVASPPPEPSSPRIILNTILSLFLGALLASGIVMGIELNDRRLRSVEDVSAALGQLVLGVVPKVSFNSSMPDSPGARRLTSQVTPTLAGPTA